MLFFFALGIRSGGTLHYNILFVLRHWFWVLVSGLESRNWCVCLDLNYNNLTVEYRGRKHCIEKKCINILPIRLL
ncbi:hypothetical protein F4820DRAFT_427832 [Hypoxylon rubiginosum]|uniref:Uncharacterized protein n=1 Tax=Hypoxylon rubiginosum TaxID=110542 RepID=A0ACB9YVB4_9PEZI|nr:hypothetical protein F4820DRAFT_427832 [Hypoxylon rubiginosum]